jgi:hypothetical protein
VYSLKTSLVLIFCAAVLYAAPAPRTVAVGEVRGELRDRLFAVITVDSWPSADSAAANMDAVLSAFRFMHGLVLKLPPCAAADSLSARAMLGRFTSLPVGAIQPRGEWQFTRPVVIVQRNSSLCPDVLTLNTLRWVELYNGSSLDGALKRAKHLSDVYRSLTHDAIDGLFSH